MTFEYVSVLEEKLNTIEKNLNKYSIIDNYEKILDENFHSNETKENVLSSIEKGKGLICSDFKKMKYCLQK